MNILLIGSGGREHALAWKIADSPLVAKLYCAPGNPGIATVSTCMPLDVADYAAVVNFCRERSIDLVVVGPEGPLVAGLVDDLSAAGIKAFGPSRAAAQLEGSKGFAKDLCGRANIPTATYRRCRSLDGALAYLDQTGAPVVVKADGLAAGKGVTVAMTRVEAEAALREIFAGRFGQTEAVIEEYLEGEEASFFALCDGKIALPFGTAQDHKRAFDGDQGPNTGGMGAFSPAANMPDAMCTRVMHEIIDPTVNAMAKAGMPFKGALYAGLMLTKSGPRLIEFNVRFGDPEAQVLMLRLKDDLVTLMLAACDGTLDKVSVRWHADPALAVVMATRGYPGDYRNGSEIGGLDRAAAVEGVEIFHAGTKQEGGRLLASGGRVLNVAATGATFEQARGSAYRAVDLIDWPEGFCRRDIGLRAVASAEAR